MENNNVTNEDLAMMIKKGFDGVDGRFDRVEQDIKLLKQGHEEIKLRQDGVAYRFEVDEIKARLQKVENKLAYR